jgi:Tol biopolymer transport system component
LGKKPMRYLSALSLILLVLSCEKNENLIDGSTVIWGPNPVAVIDNNQILLNWLNISIFNDVLLPYTYVEPDIFEIYISKGTADNFTRLIEIYNDGDYSYQIENLTNGQSYYFYVVSKKKNYSAVYSDTIMAIPNQQTNSENLITFGNSHTITSVSLAPQKDKIAYVDKSYSWEDGENCCKTVAVMTSNLDGSETELLEINAFEPCWSPNNMLIAFRTENGEINRGNGMPSQIALFDYDTKTISKLTNDTIYNYAPVFSENGDLILYQSSKNSPSTYSTNIWLMNLNTSEAIQVTDIVSMNLRDVGRPNWSGNDHFLFHGIGQDYKAQIYESSVTLKQVKRKILSDWNDYCPSVSPDKKNIAFISDRSGDNQIWLYSNENKSLRQLTGFPSLGGVDRWWNRIVWLNDSNILFTLWDNELIKLSIE